MSTAIDKPSFILQGSSDAIVRSALNSEPFFDSSADPRYLVSIDNGSHAGFLTQGPVLDTLGPSADGVICAALAPVLGDDPIAQACQVCDPPPAAPQLPSVRQHELTRAGVVAFFDGYLRCSALSLAYLKNIYDHENGELSTSYSGTPSNTPLQCVSADH